MANGDGSDSEGSSDGEGVDRTGAKASASGVYRPPRLAPVPYTGDERKGKKVRKPPAGNALVRDMATTMANASNPYIESTSGLSITPSLQSRKASKLKDIERYEEENFTRLFMTKKDAKRRRMDEEDIALGGTGSREDLMAGSKGVRGKKSHGLENEFDDLLGSIGKKRKTGAADGYSAFLSLLCRTLTRSLALATTHFALCGERSGQHRATTSLSTPPGSSASLADQETRRSEGDLKTPSIVNRRGAKGAEGFRRTSLLILCLYRCCCHLTNSAETQ